MGNKRTIRLIALELCVLAGCGDPLADADTQISVEITEVSPSHIPSRGGVEVVLAGENFAADVEVTIGGQAVLSLARKSDHLLTFVAPALPVGGKELVVKNPNGQSATSSRGLFYYAETIDFAKKFVIGPIAVTESWAGDITGDGLADVLAAKPGYNDVGEKGYFDLVYARDSNGQFHLWAEGAWRDASSVMDHRFLADVNGDGRADQIFQSGKFALATPSGFGPTITLPPGSSFTRTSSVLAGDYDGDGRAELLALDDLGEYSYIHKVSLNGAVESRQPGFSRCAGFSCARWLYLTSNYFPIKDAVGDFNNDGFDDVALIGQDQRLHMLHGPNLDEAWNLLLPSEFANQLPNTSVQDFDGDGQEELLVVARNLGFVFDPNSEGLMKVPSKAIPLCPTSEPATMVATAGRSWTKDSHRTATIKMSCDDKVWQWQAGQAVPSAQTRGNILADLNSDHSIDSVSHDDDAITGLLAGDGEHFLQFPSFSVDDPASLVEEKKATLSTVRLGEERRLIAGSGHLLSMWESEVAGFRPVSNFVLDPALSILSLSPCDVNADGTEELLVILGHTAEISMFMASWNQRQAGSSWVQGPIHPLQRSRRIPSSQTTCEVWSEASVWRVTSEGVKVFPLDVHGAALGFYPEAYDFNGDGKTDLWAGDEIFFNHGDYHFSAPQKTFHFPIPLGNRRFTFTTTGDTTHVLFNSDDGLGQASLTPDFHWNVTDFLSFDHASGKPQLGDLNGDGSMDVVVFGFGAEFAVVPSTGARVPGIFEGKPQTFALLGPYAPPAIWRQPVFFDGNGDGLDDIFFVSAEVPTMVSMVHNQSY